MAGFAFITLPLGLMFFFSGFIINGLQVGIDAAPACIWDCGFGGFTECGVAE